ncbi:unnamed protein product [Spirodela intermedia]|uniref:Bifunctional inhibitor/plant lipid transfer protein/seed storage helical domain-containing protein n=1 Tax=Spirodela intermedia TaxID=51605 RepID=A0A7I8J3W0_SPIIN|nr:unnamed protein product [Spirodela intermedia]CAA6664040.1 unnamed protein product [Spirodela intermedia]
MGGGARALVFLLAFVLLAGRVTPDDSSQERCSSEVQNVGSCTDYGTGKTELPGDKCCNAAKSVNDKNRVCLCYLIQEVYKENPGLKPLKLQGPRLLQLPKSCNFPNTSVSDCIGTPILPRPLPRGGNPGGDGFAIRARYSYAFASAVLSAVALSVFSN